MKHTPGRTPWHVGTIGSEAFARTWVFDKDGHVVAQVYGMEPLEEKAHAALIAAAPDMLAALNQIKQALTCKDFIKVTGDLVGQVIAGEAFAAVDAAIAKATNTQGGK